MGRSVGSGALPLSPWGCTHRPTKALRPTPRGGSRDTGGLSCVSRSVVSASLCPMDCSPPGHSVHEILQARILEWVALSLLQRIFPTQGWNPGLPHCRRILYRLSQQGRCNGLAGGGILHKGRGAIPHHIRQLVGRTQRRPSVPPGGGCYHL